MAEFKEELKKYIENVSKVALTGTHKLKSDVLEEFNDAHVAVYTITDAVGGGTFVLTLDGDTVTPESTLVYNVKEGTYELTASKANYVTQVISVVVSRAEMILAVKALTVTLIAE